MLTPLHAVDAPAPRCRMCPLPARWVASRSGPGRYGSYCAGMSCTNRVRICQSCENEFDRDSPGAGSKYCSTDCKLRGYHPRRATSGRLARCAWCGQSSTSQARNGGIWPYLCSTCTGPIRHVIGRLKEHRVSAEMAHRLTVYGGCEICGIDLLTPVPDGTGKYRARLRVDHDHTCCPRAHSCGTCVRGFLCGKCNSAIGMLGDSAVTALRAHAYLEGR
jgi:hypothetical protein